MWMSVQNHLSVPVRCVRTLWDRIAVFPVDQDTHSSTDSVQVRIEKTSSHTQTDTHSCMLIHFPPLFRCKWVWGQRLLSWPTVCEHWGVLQLCGLSAGLPHCQWTVCRYPRAHTHTLTQTKAQNIKFLTSENLMCVFQMWTSVLRPLSVLVSGVWTQWDRTAVCPVSLDTACRLAPAKVYWHKLTHTHTLTHTYTHFFFCSSPSLWFRLKTEVF